ncbi:MAG: hypothetical protein A2X34_02330 [Elusimicrobia bacterium GWC2_51_8]|nr:MAG: hypothetical protein A2X33_05195 [Elusimicrobia bacterium GWA2_51_34]OGR59672.1 MAG: hypothetical protein A2X34_02330 [Elusimicrobia bacterium GWC2_51_8]OGR87262.1 MAG: hypothetical protein A2021_02840 [Elusimicrobia bacterium GWF2_52_66]HAF95975.1 hypothetical protein [Elusimicrobiota bacterium]HCE99074.1 hypothetical protein [Elusimicrobiota bacterium]
MKKINLKTVLELATALVFLGVSLGADNNSVMGSRMAMAAKADGFNTLMIESFGNYGEAGSDKARYAEKKLTPGSVKEKGLLSKAPHTTRPQAVITSPMPETPADLSLRDANLKEDGMGLETRRTKRVSRLEDPGEAMGGGRKKHLKEDAKRMEAQNRMEAVAN